MVNVFPKDITPWSGQDANPGPSAPDPDALSTRPQRTLIDGSDMMTIHNIISGLSNSLQALQLSYFGTKHRHVTMTYVVSEVLKWGCVAYVCVHDNLANLNHENSNLQGMTFEVGPKVGHIGTNYDKSETF